MSPLAKIGGLVGKVKALPGKIVAKITGKKANNAPEGKMSAQEKLGAVGKVKNVKEQKQAWMDLILSKEFDKILDDVFSECCAMNDDGVAGPEDNSLDAGELTVAMEKLYMKLDNLMGGGGKLPIVKIPVADILSKYDEDNDGALDRKEFQGFAKTYFSRLEWPKWKVVVRGFIKGSIFYFLNELVISPFVEATVGVMMPIIMAKAQEEMKKLMGEQAAAARFAMKKKLAGMKPGGNDADGDGIPDELEDLMRQERWAKRMKTASEMATFGSGFAAGALAGLPVIG
jgi:hypothetical protein